MIDCESGDLFLSACESPQKLASVGMVLADEDDYNEPEVVAEVKPSISQ